MIEAEYEVVDEGGPAARGTSGWTRPQPVTPRVVGRVGAC